MMRRLYWTAALLAMCALPAAMRGQHPVMEIKVSGNQRLSSRAVIAASGLHKGRMATRPELDAVARKPSQTGFFSSVSYQYDPKTVSGVTGYDLTLLVTEDTALANVELDVPGAPADALWVQLRAAAPLIDQQIPNNERASAYFLHVLDGVLRASHHAEEIVMKNEVNLSSGRMTMVFRPASLPKIGAIRFEGNAAITEARLQAAIAKVSIGEEFTDRQFRTKLDLNLRPLYEELGHLTVAFPRVTTAAAADASLTVTAAIDEGPAWRLGRVDLIGDHLPLADMHDAVNFERGSPANWKEFMTSVYKLDQVLKRDGYIRVSSKPVRVFHESDQIVDVNVEINKGTQYRFRELKIEGLDAETGSRLAKQWKLQNGEPMNEPYINEFVRSVMPMLRNKVRSYQSELQVADNSNLVDVFLKFR